MTHYLFKPKKRDVVQYIIVLAVISIILAFAFPKIKDKMGATHNATINNIDIGTSGMFAKKPGATTTIEDFEDSIYNFSINTWNYNGWAAQSGNFVAHGYYWSTPIYLDEDCYGCSEPIIGYDYTGETNTATITLTVPSGKVATLDFDYKVSSQQNSDFLTITLDSGQLIHVSGDSGWQHYQKEGITSGTHYLYLYYSKDNSGDGGSDAGYMDNLELSY